VAPSVAVAPAGEVPNALRLVLTLKAVPPAKSGWCASHDMIHLRIQTLSYGLELTKLGADILDRLVLLLQRYWAPRHCCNEYNEVGMCCCQILARRDSRDTCEPLIGRAYIQNYTPYFDVCMLENSDFIDLN
jgi:hypothetical protein